MSKSPIISLGCGIDVSKDKSFIYFGIAYGGGTFKCKGSKAIKMTSSEIKKTIGWVIDRRLKVDPTGELPFQIVMESTSRYHERLLFAFHEAGLPICLPQSRRVKNYISSLEWNSKNDPLDAMGLAHFACNRKSRLWEPFSPHTLELRELLRARKSLINKQVRLRNQLHALSHGKFISNEVIRTYKRLARQITKEIEKLEKVINEVYKSDEKLVRKVGPIVKAVSGLGLLTVLTIAAETNGFATTTSRKQLAKYAGYDVIERESGKYRGKPRISKRGNKHIRTSMYMGAVSHIRFGTGDIVNAYARAQAKKPGEYKHGNVIVQRKLLLLIYTLCDPFYGLNWKQPKANRPSTENKSTPELSSEVHGIATSEEVLP